VVPPPEQRRRLLSCGEQGATWCKLRALTGSATLDAALSAEEPSKPQLVQVLSCRADDKDATRIVRLRLGLAVGRDDTCAGSVRGWPKEAKHEKCLCTLQGTQLPRVWHSLTCPFGGMPRRRHDRVARVLELLALEIPGTDVEWLPRPRDLWI